MDNFVFVNKIKFKLSQKNVIVVVMGFLLACLVFLFQNCSKPLETISTDKAIASSSIVEIISHVIVDKKISDLDFEQQNFNTKWISKLVAYHKETFSRSKKNWGSELAWGASYAMEDINGVLEVTPTEEMADLFIAYADSVLSKRDSVLDQTKGQCMYANISAKAPIWFGFVERNNIADPSNIKQNCFNTSNVYTGRILAPIAKFVRFVKAGYIKNNKYKQKAIVYEEAIDEALTYHENIQKSIKFYTYDLDSKEYGYSIFCVDCVSDNEAASDRIGKMDPLNVVAAFGQIYLELSVHNSKYKKKSDAFVRTIVDLISRKSGTIKNLKGTWGYWPAFENRTDDISHGAMVADFIFRAWKTNTNLVSSDLLKDISDNFIDNIVTLEDDGRKFRLSSDLDGKIYYDSDSDNRSCGMWLIMADFSIDIEKICQNICEWDSNELNCKNKLNAHSYNRSDFQLYRLKYKSE